MYFKRLEMHGFKSFAEPVVIDFNEGVTCIVGPNGSGKSNISDAIRWVLGEQSPKALRGGKMEEVIFNGTASRKSRGMAEVTLVIDNTEGILPIDFSEVAITRRMYRSGESEYLINNNQCRLRDIKELIMDTGIGVDGYSIIGQGKIQGIVDGKPEDRREILEESAGVVMYKSKKHEAELKLDRTQTNLDRVNDIISEIEGRIDGLKEDSVKAKEALQLREKRRDLEINITLRNVEKYNMTNEAGIEDINQLGKSLEELENSDSKLDENIQAVRDKNDNLEKLGNEAREKLLAKIDELNAVTNKSQLDSEKLAGFDRDVERLNSEIRVLEEKRTKELQKSEEYQNEKEDAQKLFEVSDKKLQNAISEYNEVMSRSIDISEKIQDAQNQIIDLNRDAAFKRSEAKSSQSMIEVQEKRKKEILQEKSELEQGQTEQKRILQSAIDERDEIIKESNDVQLDIVNKKAGKDETAELIRELSRKSEDLKIKRSQSIARKKTIEEMEANYEGYNGAVRFIMKSGIKGIHGVVGDLLNVPSKYETAIETALGGMLQNIVCEKDNDAKKAIELLKAQRAGRLTFLPMESVRGQNGSLSSAAMSARGFEGMANELVEFDSVYEGIFSYLLGRVAIVKDMDTAIQLSKITGSGIRFVTLDGEVINQSGAITGGKFKNQTANLLSRKNEILKLENTIEELNKEFEENESELKEKTDADIKLGQEIRELEGKKSSIQEELTKVLSRVSALETNASNSDEMNIKRDNELRTIDEQIEQNNKYIEKYNKEAENLENEALGMQKEVDSYLVLQSEIEKETDSKRELITGARIEKSKLEGEVKTKDELLESVLDAIDDFTEQIDSKEEELESLDKKRSGILYGADDAEGKAARLKSEKEELDEYISRVSEEKEQVNKELTGLLAEHKEIAEKINSYRDQKQQQEIRLARNETQLENAKQKLWDDFEISYAQALLYKRDDFVLSTAVKESRDIKNRLDELGDINVGAIKEYEEVSERYSFLTEQRNDISNAKDELLQIITDMDKTIKVKFKENFDKVVVNFEDIFKELFGGGHAELRLDNPDNPLESGIEIIAQPPGKKLQNINLMSGGEKSMTAIALMFAVLRTKPTPFCILDEVEAALDDANIDRFANYLKHFNEIQFAVVTHQKVTMEHADVLYGVTMPEQGISKVLSLRLGDNFEL